MDAMEGRRGGAVRDSGIFAQGGEGRGGDDDRLAAVLQLVRRDAGVGADWSAEFDGIRSEVDFRRAMALEEERLRGTWSQRLMRTFSAMRLALRNSRPLRLLR